MIRPSPEMRVVQERGQDKGVESYGKDGNKKNSRKEKGSEPDRIRMHDYRLGKP